MLPVLFINIRVVVNNFWGVTFMCLHLTAHAVNELSVLMTVLSVINRLMETPLTASPVLTITGIKQETRCIGRNVASRSTASGT